MAFLKSALGDHLVYDLSNALDQLQAQLELALNQSPALGVAASGQIAAVQLQSLQLGPQDLTAWISIRGAAKLEADAGALQNLD